MITPEGKVKILDFGLAKAYVGETTGIDIANSPTITAQMTEPGVILGTAAYMSPEQARSRSVDRRADIWAFGCVLYECLTGTRAFYGETVSDTLAHILKGEPDWSMLPEHTPVNVRSVLRRCLQKDPKHRIHDVADAWLEIEAPVASSPDMVAVSKRFSPQWLVAGGAALLVVGIIIGLELIKYIRPAHAGAEVTTIIRAEPGHWLDGMRRDQEAQRPNRTAMAISRDGSFLVYSAIEEDPSPQAKPQLYVRKIDQLEAKPIPGTEGGICPFLSPDDRWIGFWADGQLKKVPVEGGVPAVLCEAGGLFGASWGRDNSILFAAGVQVGLTRISAEGGKPEIMTTPDPKRQELSHRLPFCLPNGKAVLFTVVKNSVDIHPWIAVLQLKTREWRKIIEDAADPKFLAGGYLVFLRQGTLMAARFDPDRLELISQAYPIRANVMQALTGKNATYNSGAGQFAISDSGAIVYAAGGVMPPSQNSLVWVDQKGVEQSAAPIRLSFLSPRLSPDGQRIAYQTSGKEWLIGVYDLNTGTNIILTLEGKPRFPVWAPDGKRLVFGWTDSQVFNLYTQPYDGSQPMERLISSEYTQSPSSWARNTNRLAIVESHPETGSSSIALLELGSRQVRPFPNSQYLEQYPDIAPDERWIAYTSNESNVEEVYVRPLSDAPGKWQISNNGGIQPLWARDGKRLYYRWQNQVWAVDIRTEGGFSFGNRRMLFERPGYVVSTPIRSYDLSLDGQRFLMVKLDERRPTPVTEIILIQNWIEELKRIVPAGKK